MPSARPIPRRPFVVAALLALGAACATTPKPITEPSRARHYYPLAVGNSWTYRITPAPPEQPTGTVEITAEDQGFFTLNVGGKLAARTTSVTDGTRDLIREPLTVGSEWVAVLAANEVERYSIASLSAEVKTDAGPFRGCLQVRTEQEVRSPEGKKGKLVGVWSYAPFIGPVHFRQTVTVEGEQERVNVEYVLVKYHVVGGTDG